MPFYAALKMPHSFLHNMFARLHTSEQYIVFTKTRSVYFMKKGNPKGKMRYKVICVTCGRIISSDRNERDFRVEVRSEEHEDEYDKITKCPRCHTWLGVYR